MERPRLTRLKDAGNAVADFRTLVTDNFADLRNNPDKNWNPLHTMRVHEEDLPAVSLKKDGAVEIAQGKGATLIFSSVDAAVKSYDTSRTERVRAAAVRGWGSLSLIVFGAIATVHKDLAGAGASFSGATVLAVDAVRADKASRVNHRVRDRIKGLVQ
ncbi:MAG: hypothetical protein H0W89_06620 [Candidatus Levybacteria bacterium]|nr:hypothetical protein [Candidatus Levybacteria bacterium]